MYDAAQGWRWIHCANARDDPCGQCPLGTITGLYSHVACDVVDPLVPVRRIVEIRLRDNAMRGLLAADVARLDALRLLDLTTSPTATAANANVFFNPYCVSIPRCRLGEMACVLGGSGATVCP